MEETRRIKKKLVMDFANRPLTALILDTPFPRGKTTSLRIDGHVYDAVLEWSLCDTDQIVFSIRGAHEFADDEAVLISS